MLNRKHKFNLALSILFAGTAAICLFKATTDDNKKYAEVNSTSYNLLINDGVDVSNDHALITNDRGSSFEFKFSYYTKGDGVVGTLANSGEILNYTAFHSLESISINLDSGSLSFYTGWRQYSTSDIEYSVEPKQNITSTGVNVISLSDIKPSYFKLVSSGNTVIRSISLVYTCSASSTVSDLRVKLATPTVGGSGQISNSNYVWINTNIEDTSASWGSYLMTKDTDGSWYYDFNDVAVLSTGYQCVFYVSDSNDHVSDWGDEYSSGKENPFSFGIGEGQLELTFNDVDFSTQPTPVAETYSLNLTINTTGEATNFGSIQFIYNYSNSTSDYKEWITISSSWQSSYVQTFSDLDASKTLYFRIYMWTNGTAVYVGNGDANFSITPTGNDIQATVDFTYSNVSPITGTLTVSGSGATSMSHENVALDVYGKAFVAPTFEGESESFVPTYSGENINISYDQVEEKYVITGVKAGTNTSVKLTSNSGLECTFVVSVNNSSYVGNFDLLECNKGQAISTYEGWFTSTDVEEISDMGSDFYNGIDISSFKALIDNGSKFYNFNGTEQHLMYILKDAGVNWIRLKLWVDPQSSDGTLSYGGGESNLSNTLWMAKEAKNAGLNLLLDFHYSDYWTHPGQQVLPKSWNDCNSKSALCARIKSYTTNTLNTFKTNGCLPDMVQLGNEISSGIYLQKYTGGAESLDGDYKPSYLTANTSYAYGTTTASQYSDYIKAASEGVDEVNSSIKKVLHWAKGSSISSAIINNFFNNMPSDYYDYAAISYYPFYCFDTMATARSYLNGINISKPWFVAETAYPFSGDGYVWIESTDTNYTNFSVSNWTATSTTYNPLPKNTITIIKNSYPFNPVGQANLIHDLTDAVVSAGGLGIFYWESAWIPNLNVGWAAEGSLNTYGNQGFFSFDGKAIANLDLFAQMSPHI